jgi:hemoglobin
MIRGYANTTTTYQQVGGEQGVRAMVDAFYDRMDTWPDAAVIRAMHPADLSESREKLFEFLSGWLGGPPLYGLKYGHPRLRARHLPFSIGTPEAEAWMACMRHALAEAVPNDAVRVGLELSFEQLAMHMRNREDEVQTDASAFETEWSPPSS